MFQSAKKKFPKIKFPMKKKKPLIIDSYGVVSVKLSSLLSENDFFTKNLTLKSSSPYKSFKLYFTLHNTDNDRELAIEFLRKNEAICKEVYITVLDYEIKAKLYVFPNNIKKLTIDVLMWQYTKTSVFKNISMLNIDQVRIYYTNGIAKSFKRLNKKAVVLKDSYSFKSNMSYKFPSIEYVLYYCFMNESNYKFLNRLETNVDFRKNPHGVYELDPWKKCQITRLVQIIQKNNKLKWIVKGKEINFKSIVEKIWKFHNKQLTWKW